MLGVDCNEEYEDYLISLNSEKDSLVKRERNRFCSGVEFSEMFLKEYFPEDVQEFVERTQCDSLAIAIGTSHGAYKFKPGTDPKLRLDILEEVGRRLPGFPIVLHGSSSEFSL